MPHEKVKTQKAQASIETISVLHYCLKYERCTEKCTNTEKIEAAGGRRRGGGRGFFSTLILLSLLCTKGIENVPNNE